LRFCKLSLGLNFGLFYFLLDLVSLCLGLSNLVFFSGLNLSLISLLNVGNLVFLFFFLVNDTLSSGLLLLGILNFLRSYKRCILLLSSLDFLIHMNLSLLLLQISFLCLELFLLLLHFFIGLFTCTINFLPDGVFLFLNIINFLLRVVGLCSGNFGLCNDSCVVLCSLGDLLQTDCLRGIFRNFFHLFIFLTLHLLQ